MNSCFGVGVDLVSCARGDPDGNWPDALDIISESKVLVAAVKVYSSWKRRRHGNDVQRDAIAVGALAWR